MEHAGNSESSSADRVLSPVSTPSGCENRFGGRKSMSSSTSSIHLSSVLLTIRLKTVYHFDFIFTSIYSDNLGIEMADRKMKIMAQIEEMLTAKIKRGGQVKRKSYKKVLGGRSR